VFYLGLEGWRHAGTVYPLVAKAVPPIPEPALRTEPAGRDWESQGREWLTRTEDAGWWRNPDLSLERLARHLGTNTAYLSRALNEGLGLSFNAAINRLRVIDVCRRLSGDAADDDLLSVAFAAGFSSKTSFNRTFKAQVGKTPSQFRESAAQTRSES
jgi:AraC-like DNA-binding protein